MGKDDPGYITELAAETSYGGYLELARLLSAQRPRSSHHDEMLFIIQHQTSELWMKLLLHELAAAIEHVKADRLAPCFKILARVKQVQRQLFEQWAVLETLTPSEYAQFRNVLGPASGLQSHQFRAIEFMLGNKNAQLVELQRHDEPTFQYLRNLLGSPSLYDEFLRYLARRGMPVPAERVERDWTAPYQRHPGVTAVFKTVYENTERHWAEYDMCEKLVDVEENFVLWRFRHVKTVERIIGFKKGTGGTAGVPFLRRTLELSLFPELIDVRTEIG
ncbi:MAG TPA: tryptophan 2,3-dioxygenase family protein [Burkholderiales bacterium]|jgi:tryptophan 2,3-dioxygenase|nr:tryptophan 2,3-dioxygenase family protein [Burkholderiales bacterium]